MPKAAANACQLPHLPFAKVSLIALGQQCSDNYRQHLRNDTSEYVRGIKVLPRRSLYVQIVIAIVRADLYNEALAVRKCRSQRGDETSALLASEIPEESTADLVGSKPGQLREEVLWLLLAGRRLNDVGNTITTT